MPRKVSTQVLSHVIVDNVRDTSKGVIHFRGNPAIKSVFDLPGQSSFGIASLSNEEDAMSTPIAVCWYKVEGESSAIVLGKTEKFLGIVSIDDPMEIARVPYMVTIAK